MSTLLHIGVPKTGTTAVQAALTDLLSRGVGPGAHPTTGQIGDLGISMPGTPAQQARAALSVLGQGQGWRKNEAVAKSAHWPRLVAGVREATGTAIVSSEYLCEAEPKVIRRIADDLGPDLRVVVTLRPLGRILPSAWQQYLKSGHQLPYEKWLRAVLAEPPNRSVTPSFWRRHDHPAVIARWATELGADRITVIVVDDSDHGLLLRSFDELLGLTPGTLTPGPSDRSNRSMTAAEAELFRRINLVLRKTAVPWSDYAQLIRYGAILRAVERNRPDRQVPRTVTPPWALDRAAALGAGYVRAIDALRANGLRVMGNLETLGQPLSAKPTGNPDSPVGSVPDSPVGSVPDQVPIDVAVEALLGVIARAVTGELYFPEEDDRPAAAAAGLPGSEPLAAHKRPAHQLTSEQLARILARRVRRKLTRRAARLTSSGSAGTDKTSSDSAGTD